MGRLRAIVIGSAAGGGYPQWNCRAPVSAKFWNGDDDVIERSQSSVAVSSDGENWALLNCSPDIRQQIIRTPALHPRHAPRHSPIGAIILTNGDIDHIAGLLTLREKQAFRLLGTKSVLDVLESNAIFNALDPDFVTRTPVQLGHSFPLIGELTAEIFPVPGKVPLYMEDGEPEIGAESENTIGVKISDDLGNSMFYVPGCAFVSEGLRQRLQQAEVVLFDGTLWQDDEMIQSNTGVKTGNRMGHISMSGPDGSIAAFQDINVDRKIFVHINNTNPVLIEGSHERAQVTGAGWEIAYDGMEIDL